MAFALAASATGGIKALNPIATIASATPITFFLN
jgi:hypothetical protein